MSSQPQDKNHPNSATKDQDAQITRAKSINAPAPMATQQDKPATLSPPSAKRAANVEKAKQDRPLTSNLKYKGNDRVHKRQTAEMDAVFPSSRYYAERSREIDRTMQSDEMVFKARLEKRSTSVDPDSVEDVVTEKDGLVEAVLKKARRDLEEPK